MSSNDDEDDEDESPELVYRVRYQLATYSGHQKVVARSEEQAIAKVQRWARSQTSLTMYYEHYEVVEARP